MSGHGPQFDEFHASPTHSHGGAEYDELGKPSAQSTKSTGLADLFPQKQGRHNPHGEHWDEFGWREMPLGHGATMDSDFSAPAALDDSTGHGTWHDVFRGGTQVRYVVDGCDYEGTVLNAGSDHLIVRPPSGGANGGGVDHEIGLMQLRAFRNVPGADQSDAKKPTATPGHTDAPWKDSPAEAPSAHDATARGGGERTPVDVEAATSTAPLNKTELDELDELDVAKTLDDLRTLAGE